MEASKTRLNELKDSASNLQSTILETDKRITSLESRFESLRDDPAAVAVEMANLQNKASELGITLSTFVSKKYGIALPPYVGAMFVAIIYNNLYILGYVFNSRFKKAIILLRFKLFKFFALYIF